MNSQKTQTKIQAKAQINQPQIIVNQYKTNIILKNILIGLFNFLSRLFKGDLDQRLGRFLLVRKTYSVIKKSQQLFQCRYCQNHFQTGFQSVVHDVRVDDFVKEVDKNSVAFGFSIPDSMVEEIFHYATHSTCSEPGFHKPFSICDLDEHGYLPDGHKVIRALVSNPSNCQAINTIAQDSLLLQIASTYLRYYPTQVKSDLAWSLDCNYVHGKVTDLYPACNFHYDIAGYNFATAYFYITPIQDEFSGPHVMIKKSHKKKPFWLLSKSGPYSDDTIYSYYDQKDEIKIFGGAGFGFFQDPSCFHKVKVPMGTNRLILLIRYS